MKELLINIYHILPAEWSTLLIATLPVAELRLALPLALTVTELNFWSAYFWSVVGNIIPAILIIYLLEPLSNWIISLGGWPKQFIDWLFNRTRRKTTDKIRLYGEIALVLFVAIPLPFTGAWTGSIAAFLFNIKPRVALPLIFLGVLIAGLIVGMTTIGIKKLI